MLVAADATALAKARASARNLGALRDLTNDRHRLNRFNAEQREQHAKRLISAKERLPQQVTMAYRHLVLLGDADGKGTELDHVASAPREQTPRFQGRWPVSASPTFAARSAAVPALMSCPPRGGIAHSDPVWFPRQKVQPGCAARSSSRPSSRLAVTTATSTQLPDGLE
jgi:hypothetical protein